MVLPITGPISVVQNVIPPIWVGGGPGNIYAISHREATWYRQKTPYDRPLAFDSFIRRVDQPDPLFVSAQAANTSGDPSFRALSLSHLTNEQTWALNKAYSKFKASTGEAASWLTNLAERHETMSLLTNLLTRLYGFSIALRKQEWTRAVYTLAGENQEFVKRGKRLINRGDLGKKSKDFANNWLAFHFGLEPLYQDVYNSINALQQPLKDQALRSGSRVVFRYVGNGFPLFAGSVNDGYVYCVIGGNVSVTNPNLFLANQMGLVNPLAAAFDMIRFSFVLDWFVNVQDVLTAWSDFAGLTFSGAYYTIGCKSYNSWTQKIGSDTHFGDTSCFEVHRNLGLPPGPTLTIRKPWHLSASRGLTAASLLVQTLRR